MQKLNAIAVYVSSYTRNNRILKYLVDGVVHSLTRVGRATYDSIVLPSSHMTSRVMNSMMGRLIEAFEHAFPVSALEFEGNDIEAAVNFTTTGIEKEEAANASALYEELSIVIHGDEKAIEESLECTIDITEDIGSISLGDSESAHEETSEEKDFDHILLQEGDLLLDDSEESEFVEPASPEFSYSSELDFEDDEDDRLWIAMNLEETIVHCFEVPSLPDEDIDAECNIVIPLETDTDFGWTMYGNMRPHLTEFIERVSKFANLAIYSSLPEDRVYPLLDYVDPQTKITKVLCRANCVQSRGKYLKNLTKFEVPLRRIAYIDSKVDEVFVWQRNNVVPIKLWEDDPHDNELLKLVPILQQFSRAESVKPLIKKLYWNY